MTTVGWGPGLGRGTGAAVLARCSRPRASGGGTKWSRPLTKKYNVSKLVYYEAFDEIMEAIAREKQIKGRLRKKKIALIESVNPEWNDLYELVSCG